MSENYNLGEAFAVATQYIDSKTTELFGYVNPLLTKIMENKEYVDGGTYLQVGLQADEMGNIQYITGTAADTIDTSPQKNMAPASLPWKHIQTGFSVTLDDLAKTADSKHAIASLLTKKAENSLASTKQFMAMACFNSATGDTKSLNGLKDMMADSGVSYAGLVDTEVGNDKVGDAKWLPLIDKAANNIVSYDTIEPMLTRLKTKASFAGVGNSLDFMISNAYCLSAFKQKHQLNQRFIAAKNLQAGFDGVEVDGVTWYADPFSPGSGPDAADNWLSLISSNSIKFMYKYGYDGKNSPMDVSGLRLPNQPIISHQRYITGNFFMVDRRVNGVFKTLRPKQAVV